jgi:tetratricopeptide (TPR) repeat protein
MTLDSHANSLNTKQYAAFISYSHRDRRWAQWLHRAIETYRIPKNLLRSEGEDVPRPALSPIFLDRAELPTSADLAAAVREALSNSAALIVVCSPSAAQSRWVNEEVRAFKSLGRDQRILCLVVDGDPAVGDCFPEAIRYQVENGVVSSVRANEPLAADVRTGGDDRNSARLKIVAGLLGVSLDQLRQRELARRQRRLAIIAGASAIGCVVFAVLAAVALTARADAVQQKANAERQSLTARRTAEFMKSLFAVTDPSEARGNSITAREVLDRGARQIDTQLADAPLVRADLMTSLGEVYASLGLLNDSLKLLNGAATTPAQPAELVARRATALAELQYSRGDYDAALRALGEARAAMQSTAPHDVNVELRMLSTFGDVYDRKDDAARARGYFAQALKLASAPAVADRSVQARALEGIAQEDLAEDRFEQAAAGFSQALRVQIAATGELHPRVSEVLNQLGSLEYMRGRRDAAADYFRRCLAIDRRVYGMRHSGIGPTLNNLGRVLLEQRHFDEAGRLLSESIDVRKAEVLDTSDPMAFAFSNLALTRMGVGDLKSAESLFDKGLRAAIINKHRLHGPILTDLADLECRTKRYALGLQRLDEARPIVAARYPDEPWRVAHVDNVRAGCLTGLRRYGEAAQLIESSLPLILAKWPPNTLYGHDALERTMRLYSLTDDPTKLAQYRRLAKGQ